MCNSKYDLLLKNILLKQADIIMLVETDQNWLENLKEIEKNYPYRHYLPLNNTYGILIYSKLEFYNAKFKYLVNDEIPSFHATFKFEGHQIKFYGLHPEPPFPSQSKDTVERDAEILMVGKKNGEEGGITIVAGDLNDVSWSYTTKLFQKVSGMLDPRLGRGFFSTFHARKVWARWPLDHVFCSKDFNLVKMERLGYIGSDHFPIYLELSLSNRLGNNEKPEKVDDSESEYIEQKINMV